MKRRVAQPSQGRSDRIGVFASPCISLVVQGGDLFLNQGWGSTGLPARRISK
jgi:hypothetical protein